MNQLPVVLVAFLAGAALTVHAADRPAGEKLAAWGASPTAPVVREDKSFTHDGVDLKGTLYLPANARRVPAVIALHSASSPTRDLALYNHLKQMLPPLGVAVFVYDRRGSGGSGGAPVRGDFQPLADDGISAQRLLAQDPRIDAARLGFWGLSQGGWLALMAAARSPEAAFVIAISAPMTTPEAQMDFAVANILRIRGYAQTDIDAALATRAAVNDFERGRLDRALAQQRLDEAASKPWFNLIYLNRALRGAGEASHAGELNFEPGKALAALRIPVLLIYGARDPWVPVEASVKAVQASAGQHRNLTLAVIAGADHDMNLSTSAEDQIDPARMVDEAPDSTEYFALLAAWLTAEGLARPPGLQVSQRANVPGRATGADSRSSARGSPHP